MLFRSSVIYLHKTLQFLLKNINNNIVLYDISGVRISKFNEYICEGILNIFLEPNYDYIVFKATEKTSEKKYLVYFNLNSGKLVHKINIVNTINTIKIEDISYLEFDKNLPNIQYIGTFSGNLLKLYN